MTKEHNGIGTFHETTLHADLKRWYARPGDELETRVDGFIVDIVRGDLLIEIQTRHFSALKHKLGRLVENHPVRLVYPIAQEKWIVRQSAAGLPAGRRRSPKKGRIEHLFRELVRIPELAMHPHFSLEVLWTREEEIRRDDGRGSWRRKGWSIYDRRLLEVLGKTLLSSGADYLALLPPDLPPFFTNRDLASALAQPRSIAQKMTYCLRRMGLLRVAGLQDRAYLYTEENL